MSEDLAKDANVFNSSAFSGDGTGHPSRPTMTSKGCQLVFSAMATLAASQLLQTVWTNFNTATRPWISAGEMPLVKGRKGR